MENITSQNLLHFDNLTRHESLVHFSTTIAGGVSTGNYASFNLSKYSGDSPSDVLENKRYLASMLDINQDNLLLPYQTHGNEVRVIDKSFISSGYAKQKELLNEVDALVTNLKGICIGVTTADCVPLIIYDPENHAVAVIHAGWRGTVARIVTKAILVMKRNYGSKPEKLIVGIAPSICQDCFEVGDEVVLNFIEAGFPMDMIGRKNNNTGKMHIDLKKANCWLLEKEGVHTNNIEDSGLCTFSDSNMFFSARRQTIYSGRMVTGVILK